MPDQFVVPQFIDVEDKILGPITVRQFVILMAGGMLLVILFKILNLAAFLLFGVPILFAALTLAFAKVNGQPFHFFLLNLVQTLRRPSLRVWDKSVSSAEAKLKIKVVEVPPPPPPVRKKPVDISHLQELSLVVNTGGVYRPEEDDVLGTKL